MDDALITLFSRIAGPTIFQTVDLMGNTPLHSAMREETNIEVLQALIRAFPEALHMRTVYGDTPLSLACLRRVDAKVVEQVAICSCAGVRKRLPIVTENTAGQTPLSIAMEEFQKSIKHMESPRTRGNCLVHQDLIKSNNEPLTCWQPWSRCCTMVLRQRRRRLVIMVITITMSKTEVWCGRASRCIVSVQFISIQSLFVGRCAIIQKRLDSRMRLEIISVLLSCKYTVPDRSSSHACFFSCCFPYYS
jgi:hypothetical protein